MHSKLHRKRKIKKTNNYIKFDKMKIKVNQANFPVWKEITCKAKVPAKMKKLQLIAENLWWVWNSAATDL